MKNLMNISKLLFLFCICFMTYSCGPGDELTTLKGVVIPEYDDSDYIKLLDDKNPEIVYNAICNLISSGSSFAKSLSDSISDPIIKAQAKDAYDKISGLLYSEDEWVVCSSLRFFSVFASDYKNKDEIVSKLLKVKLRTKSIKLEYFNTLANLKDINPEPFKDILMSYLKSDSWLVSRNSYRIIPYLNIPELNTYLLSEYPNAKDYDKLLLINTLPENYNDTILNFVMNELQIEKSTKLKLALYKKMCNAANNVKVMDWMKNNHEILNDIKDPAAEYCINQMEKPAEIQNINFLLKENLISDSLIYGSNSAFYSNLFSILNNDTLKNELIIKNVHEIEIQVLSNEIYKKNWLDYKMKNGKPNYSADLIQKQKALIKEFELKSARLLDDYKVDNNHKQEYLDRIKALEGSFEKDKN